MPSKRRKLSEVYKRFKGRCYYCSVLTSLNDPYSSNAATRDHLLPRSRGGTLISRNVVLACASCNQDKGDMTMREYKVFKSYLAAGVDRSEAKDRAEADCGRWGNGTPDRFKPGTYAGSSPAARTNYIDPPPYRGVLVNPVWARSSVAEHSTFNRVVDGSNPSEPTNTQDQG